MEGKKLNFGHAIYNIENCGIGEIVRICKGSVVQITDKYDTDVSVILLSGGCSIVRAKTKVNRLKK